MRKYWGYGEVTSPTILESQPEFVTSGFQRPDQTYILSNYMRHKVVAHKVRQIITIIQ